MTENPIGAADLREADPPQADRIPINSDGQIEIHAGYDEWIGRDVAPCIVGAEHSVYEWAMILADRHPRSPIWYGGPGSGVDDEARRDIRISAIGLDEKSRALFDAILTAYEGGKITPVPVAWYEKQPADHTLLRFRRDDILTVIRDLGADGDVIGLLTANSEMASDHATATGPQHGGRTEAKSVISIEETRRILERREPMSEAKALRAVKAEAPDKHIPRQRVREATVALGWPKQRGRPKSQRH